MATPCGLCFSGLIIDFGRVNLSSVSVNKYKKFVVGTTAENSQSEPMRTDTRQGFVGLNFVRIVARDSIR